jgi:hypothetical protein
LDSKKLRRGEICVANFIHPANGASLGDKLLLKLSSYFEKILKAAQSKEKYKKRKLNV